MFSLTEKMLPQAAASMLDVTLSEMKLSDYAIRPFMERLQPAPLDGGFRNETDWIWCGSVIRGDDDQYHMFASMWPKAVPFSPNWLSNSRIVRAVSSTPEGPYTYAGEVLPPRGPEWWDGSATHNPTIHKWKEYYLLFYTGIRYSGPQPQNEAASDALRLEARKSQRIGLAISTSPEGPWERPDHPCLEVREGHWDSFLTTNAAPCVLPDGRIHLLYKSTRSDHGPIQYGVAGAAALGEPFERLGPDAPITFGDPNLKYEDAYIWMEDGLFHGLINDMTGKLTGEDHAGAHIVSEDGISWQLNDPPKAYSRDILWADGSTTRQGSFERPQLLIQDGKPTHLFAATADGPGGFANASNTWNMVVPLR